MCQNIGHVTWYLTMNVKEIAFSETLAHQATPQKIVILMLTVKKDLT